MLALDFTLPAPEFCNTLGSFSLAPIEGLLFIGHTSRQPFLITLIPNFRKLFTGSSISIHEDEHEDGHLIADEHGSIGDFLALVVRMSPI